MAYTQQQKHHHKPDFAADNGTETDTYGESGSDGSSILLIASVFLTSAPTELLHNNQAAPVKRHNLSTMFNLMRLHKRLANIFKHN